MYQSFIPMEEVRSKPLRIHDPQSYRVSHEEQFVPVVINEAFTLAAHFPVVWKRDDVGRMQLMALRGFAKEGKELPALRRLPFDSLPLLMQAYPMRFRNHRAGEMEIGLDRVSPALARDIGSYVFNSSGGLQLGAELKVKMLETFSDGLAITEAITDTLVSANALERVSLPEAVVEEFSVPDMFYMSGAMEDAHLLGVMLDRYGIQFARFNVAHKLSLYRMGPLITMARSVAAAKVANG